MVSSYSTEWSLTQTLYNNEIIITCTNIAFFLLPIHLKINIQLFYDVEWKKDI